jgi:hypothetical protein
VEWLRPVNNNFNETRFSKLDLRPAAGSGMNKTNKTVFAEFRLTSRQTSRVLSEIEVKSFNCRLSI